jgi:hypothetical protein
MEDKISLKELKARIKHFKSHDCPRLGQKKAVLLKFAEEHGLLKKKELVTIDEHIQKALKEEQLAKKAKSGKKVKIVKKAEAKKEEKPVVEKKKRVIKVKKEVVKTEAKKSKN